MKLIIDIDENSYKLCKSLAPLTKEYISAVIGNGIPYEERAQGKWVFKDLHNGKIWYECSVCGRKIHVGDKVQLSDFPFCHCGADMRGAAQNETGN